jgi:hypothetical protein
MKGRCHLCGELIGPPKGPEPRWNDDQTPDECVCDPADYTYPEEDEW